MFTTSLDIFYAALSISVLVFTGFLVWAIFYVVQILKQGNEVIAEIREKIAEFEEALTTIKDRVMTSATTISTIAKEVNHIVAFARSMKKGKNADDSEV